ncbi:MAG: MoxR family ATPase [Dinghuibacter sp.]|nr:MoxR family ATPase [Dinghuibacter sp.]
MLTSDEIRRITEKIEYSSAFAGRIRTEMAKVVVGQHQMIDKLLVGLLCNGHILLEGVPGLAKTLAIRSLAHTIQAKFSRIQFTPDLLPADVTGTMIYNQQKNEFMVRRGPVFANFLLADEINRAPAKVQSALLEAMQERQVTIGEQTHKLEEPFLVLATQNPLEQEGTYPLPEAQTDRFLLKVVVGYPTKEEELLIIRSNVQNVQLPVPDKVASLQEIFTGRDLVRQVYADEKVERYIVELVSATRNPAAYGLQKLQPLIACGCSPRAGIGLALAARAMAFLNQRGFVIPDDIKAIAHDVLRHRLALTYEAEAENVKVTDLINEIFRAVPVP